MEVGAGEMACVEGEDEKAGGYGLSRVGGRIILVKSCGYRYIWVVPK